MPLYIAIWFLLFITIYAGKAKTILVSSIFCILVFLYSFRGIDVGVDTSTYYDIFCSISSGADLEYLEPLWKVLNKLVVGIGGNFNLLLFFSSLLMLVPVFYVVYTYSINPALSLYIYYSMYFFCGSLNISRQYLAISFILCSFCFFKSYPFRAFCCFMIALGFHLSSVFIVLIIPFLYVNISRKKALISLFFSFGIGTFLTKSLTQIILSFLYQGYAERDLFRTEDTGLPFVIAMNIFYVCVFLIADKLLLNSKWGKLYLFSALVLNLVYPLELGTRLYNIFSISNLLFYPLLLINNRLKMKKVVECIIIVFFACMFFKMISSNANEVFPYEFAVY